MAILKCGQKDNTKYTFGVRKEQIEEVERTEKKEVTKICCASCGTCLTKKMRFCPSCGEEL